MSEQLPQIDLNPEQSEIELMNDVIPVSDWDSGFASLAATAELSYGLMQMSEPGVANKMLGAGLMIMGAKHTYEAVRPINESKEGSFRDRISNRIKTFATSLIDANSGKANLREKMKLGAGEELLALQEKGYRNRFNRMIGSFAMLGVGLELSDLDTTEGKIGGAMAASFAVYENLKSFNDMTKGRDSAIDSQLNDLQKASLK